MSHTKPLSRVSQQNHISLELALATILDASIEEISEVLKQAPFSKRGKVAIAEILNFNVEEMTEVLKQVPTEKMGDIALAIGKIWQES